MTRLAVLTTTALLAYHTAVNGCQARLVPVNIDGKQYECKCSPADDCWPSKDIWAALNETVDGNLIAHIPPAAVCYDEFRGLPTYDEAACADATANWTDGQWQISQPAGALWTWGSNNTCELPGDSSETCTLGNYAEYVVMAKTKEHIQAGVNFARSHSIRLVVRNTGHDFEGRSSGAGSLAINTHGFKDITFSDSFDGPGDYDGPVVTIGAGVQGFEVLDAAYKQDPPHTVVVGECATVGIAGGFVQGGGHGPLTNLYGFAADNALSFEVITAKGEVVTADATTNPDLFWALKGGGPGTYGVVLSVTMRTYPDDIPTAGLWFNVNATTGATHEQALRAVGLLHENANDFVEQGLYAIYQLFPPAIGGSLHVQPIMGFNMTADELDAIVKPMFDAFEEEGIPYDAGTLEFSDYYTLYYDLFEPESAAQNGLTGGWTFTREDLVRENQAAIAEVMEISLAPREDMLGVVISHLFDPGLHLPKFRSAVHPRWDGATLRVMAVLLQDLDATWEEKLDHHDVMQNTITEAYKKVAPNGLSYVNENYVYMRDWQEANWGDNYPQLKEIRQKWDPSGVFYSASTPGTEEWHVVDYAHRLCKEA